MSVKRLTSAISLALCLPLVALLALCAYYAGGISPAVAGAGAFALAFQAGAYALLSNEVAKPLNAIAYAFSGEGPGLPPPDRKLPSEIESIKSYILSASALLDEYREQHRDLLMSVPDILLETDRCGRIIFVNRAAREVTGYPDDDMLGRHFLDFIAAGSRERASGALADLLEGRPVNSLELELVLSAGERRYVEFNAVPLWKEGAVAGFCCAGRDIDERRKVITELEAARRHAEEATAKLKKTVNDLEEFSLLAVRRELKMQELREMFVRLKEEHEINKEFPG